MCDLIDNYDQTGPDWDHFCRNRTGTGLAGPTGLVGFLPDLKKL